LGTLDDFIATTLLLIALLYQNVLRDIRVYVFTASQQKNDLPTPLPTDPLKVLISKGNNLTDFAALNTRRPLH